MTIDNTLNGPLLKLEVPAEARISVSEAGNTDGYDGHCLRAYAYYKEQMPDIDESVDSINSIVTKYAGLRQSSKAVTFLLTYQGTYYGLMHNCGFPEKDAREIEARYHDLYHVSDKYIADRIYQATQDGYVELAFGLRLRTPILAATTPVTGQKLPYMAQKEARTAGNALGQSWGLLNVRAAAEFMEKVRLGPYSNRITIAAQVHDAIYFIIDRDPDVLLYLNEHLVKAIEWQDHPAIAHPDIKLSGQVSIFTPSWAHSLTIPNNITKEELSQIWT